MTTKPITPSGTARDRAKAAANQPPQLDPGTQKELDRVRAEAAKFGINAPQTETSAPTEPSTVPSESFPFDVPEEIEFQLADGRLVAMGPPAVPCQLLLGKMFDDRERMDLKFQLDLRAAKVVMYIRTIDGKHPGAAHDWAAVSSIMHRLGELGFRACADVYDTYYPESSVTLYSIIKKSSRTQPSASK